ncbi:ATPase [Achromatium sp. WMS3]|nr:ATPase [Achromatium sp. WMS3]
MSYIPNTPTPIRIENLRIDNYRALHKVEFKNFTPLTTLIGPNGSGKSSVLDAFAFLSECFESGLHNAWNRRGRAKNLKTKNADGPVIIEIKYREYTFPLITYHLVLDERKGTPIVLEEWMQWRHGSNGRPYRFLEYKEGVGVVANGERPNTQTRRLEIPLHSPDLLAVNVLGQLAEHPRLATLREFIQSWHFSHFTTDSLKGQVKAESQAWLSKTGNNLANVIQYLREHNPKHLNSIIANLRTLIPQLEQVSTDAMPDGNLSLQIKDKPFEHPILASYASDGTLATLANMLLLHNPAPFTTIETPERSLHPRLLQELVEKCRTATESGQFLFTTHSPMFLNALRAEEVRLLYRDQEGYTQSVTVADIDGIPEFIAAGGTLGHLWTEGHFKVGDPLIKQGQPNLRRSNK